MYEGEEFVIYVSIVSFSMSIALSGILIWFFISFNKRINGQLLALKDAALREQALVIERQSALQKERSRIASEMHDDLGGGLTTIKFLGQRVLRSLNDVHQKDGVEKIIGQSKSLIENMGEIIWAMNSENDTLENLIAYARRFTVEYLEEFGIDCNYKNECNDVEIELTGEKRRNLFLLLKESLHNMVKHSGASKVDILWQHAEGVLSLSIFDNGKGLTDDHSTTGNGLKNMDRRARDMKGEMFWENGVDSGLHLTFKVSI